MIREELVAGRPVRALWLTIAGACAGATVFLAIPYLLVLVGLGNNGLAAVTVAVWVVLGLLAGFVAVMAAVVFVIVPRERWWSGGVLSGVAGILVAVACLGFIGGRLQDRAMAQCAASGDRILAAIRAFEKATGKPPASLSDLIPGFLSEIPSTGFGGRHEFRYRRAGGRAPYGPAWWVSVSIPGPFEFGSRELIATSNGADPPGRVGIHDRRVGEWFILRDAD